MKKIPNKNAKNNVIKLKHVVASDSPNSNSNSLAIKIKYLAVEKKIKKNTVMLMHKTNKLSVIYDRF